MIADWGIDWGRFIDIDIRSYGSKTIDAAHAVQNFKRLQLAYRIDTALVDPLGSLPASIASNPPPSLAERNLRRGSEFQLPSGQTVAELMRAPVLRDEQILIGQAVDQPETAPLDIIHAVEKAG